LAREIPAMGNCFLSKSALGLRFQPYPTFRGLFGNVLSKGLGSFVSKADLDQAADGLGSGKADLPEAGSQTEIVAESHQAGGNLPKLDESF
jgi:hypothetical protein